MLSTHILLRLFRKVEAVVVAVEVIYDVEEIGSD